MIKINYKERKKIIKEEYPKVGCDYQSLAKRLGYKNVKSLSVIANRIGAGYKNTIYETYEDEWFRNISEDNISHYKISNYGKIINENGVLLKSQLHHHSGYLQIRLLDKQNNKISRLIHILVAETFIGKKPINKVCDHIDGNRQNPSLSNLRYITQSQNVKIQPKRKHNGYLTKEQIEDICLKLQNGNSISQIINSCDFYTKSMVEKIKQKTRHKKISCNYNF